MTLSVPQFPALPGITYPAKRAPKWDTVRADALSGKRTRFANWTYPIYLYEIAFDFLRSDANNLEWQTLAGFINSMAGGYGLFGYNDVTDNTATNQSFGQGDGVTTGFQLVRALGGFAEPVFLPVLSGGLVGQITVGGTPTTAYTVSPYGVVTFNSAPAGGAALQWTGTFCWPCRFDDDMTDMAQIMQYIWELKGLKFSTEKLP